MDAGDFIVLGYTWLWDWMVQPAHRRGWALVSAKRLGRTAPLGVVGLPDIPSERSACRSIGRRHASRRWEVRGCGRTAFPSDAEVGLLMFSAVQPWVLHHQGAFLLGEVDHVLAERGIQWWFVNSVVHFPRRGKMFVMMVVLAVRQQRESGQLQPCRGAAR